MHITTYETISEFPRYISIETTSACNSKCTFCPHPLLNKNNNLQVIEDQLFQKIIQECKNYKDLEMITLSFQNEPLLDPQLFARINYVREITKGKVKICIVTNGFLLTTSRLDKLCENPPDIMKISIYGIDKKTYEDTMIGLNFDVTMNNISNLVERTKELNKPEIQINVVYTEEMAKVGYEKLKSFWKDKGLKLHLINVENRAGTLSDEAKHFSNEKWRVRSWCQRPFKQLSVFPSGDVVLCCADWKGEVILGNVYKQSLHQIWHCDLINYYRQKLKTGKIENLKPCNNCMQADIVIDGQSIVEFNKFS